MSSTLEAIKQIESQVLVEKKQIKDKDIYKNPVCCWCEYQIKDNEVFYVCTIHKNVFCEICAKNGDKKEVSYYEAPSCLEKKPFPILSTGRENLIECIYEKRVKDAQ